jgi:hypothetical protein
LLCIHIVLTPHNDVFRTTVSYSIDFEAWCVYRARGDCRSHLERWAQAALQTNARIPQ